jgi:N-acylneuraminate cytidylyltransferase
VTYVAFIPLRGGSKGIPGKNIKPIAGKPLCRWTIEAAAEAARIDRVYVATDSQEIASVVRSFGIE